MAIRAKQVLLLSTASLRGSTWQYGTVEQFVVFFCVPHAVALAITYILWLIDNLTVVFGR